MPATPSSHRPGCPAATETRRARPGAPAGIASAGIAAITALVLAPAVSPGALAEAEPFGDETPVTDDAARRGFGDAPFETHGETLLVREGHVADAAALDALAFEVGSAPQRRGTEAHHPFLQGYPDEVWIADIGTLLYDDLDGDGFFGAFGLTVDVDVEHGRREVYLTVLLLDGFGAILLSHETREFEIYARSAGDGYRVELELLDGYAAGYRDVRVEVRDAHHGTLLDAVDAHEHAALAALPLEAEFRGGRPLDDSEVFVAAGYAGAAGPVAALLLGTLALGRRVRRSRPSRPRIARSIYSPV